MQACCDDCKEEAHSWPKGIGLISESLSEEQNADGEGDIAKKNVEYKTPESRLGECAADRGRHDTQGRARKANKDKRNEYPRGGRDHLPQYNRFVKVLVDISIVPLGVGLSLSSYIAECEKIFAAAGLKTALHAYGTNVEGEWEEGVRRDEEVPRDAAFHGRAPHQHKPAAGHAH
jgi:hypothetical protein